MQDYSLFGITVWVFLYQSYKLSHRVLLYYCLWLAQTTECSVVDTCIHLNEVISTSKAP